MFYQVDLANDCIVPTEVTVSGVCATSDRCSPSAGTGSYCAIAPDGTFYLARQSDGYVYSANDWHFSYAYGTPQPPPLGESASATQLAQCETAYCFPFCSGSAFTPFDDDDYCQTDAVDD
jgi:hypothetical protein